jgi:hypothetical protein
MSEALEQVERARGALFDAHQLIGGADGALDPVEKALRDSDLADLADELRQELVGLDVLEGRWTYQVVEEFDDGYYAAWQAWERRIREATVAGRRHVAEAEMKTARQSRG